MKWVQKLGINTRTCPTVKLADGFVVTGLDPCLIRPCVNTASSVRKQGSHAADIILLNIQDQEEISGFQVLIYKKKDRHVHILYLKGFYHGMLFKQQ